MAAAPHKAPQPRKCRIYRIAILPALFALTLFAMPCSGFGFGKQLLAGLDVGYCGTYVQEDTFPSIFDGLSFGIHVLYGFNDFVGLSLEGAFDLHRSHTRYEIVEVQRGGNQTVLDWDEGPKVSNYYLSSTALSVVYALDVMRVVPFLSLGVMGARIDRKIDGQHRAEYDVGMRINVGFNYVFNNRFGLGTLFTYDQHIYANSDHKRRMTLLIRGSLVFDFNARSLAHSD